MDEATKILYFEYVLKGLLDWNREMKGSDDNDLSVLKSLKLLFFVSAAKATYNNHSNLLDDIFNDFYAMPYGHVESQIYDYIREREGNLSYYTIDSKKTAPKQNIELPPLNDEINNPAITSEIDHSISYLKKVNPTLILMSPFDLVNLSHAWYSWQHYYELAKRTGNKSIKIPAEAIKTEDKLFSLQMF